MFKQVAWFCFSYAAKNSPKKLYFRPAYSGHERFYLKKKLALLLKTEQHFITGPSKKYTELELILSNHFKTLPLAPRKA